MENNTQWITLRNWHLIQWNIKFVSVKRRKNQDQKKSQGPMNTLKIKNIKKLMRIQSKPQEQSLKRGTTWLIETLSIFILPLMRVAQVF